MSGGHHDVSLWFGDNARGVYLHCACGWELTLGHDANAALAAELARGHAVAPNPHVDIAHGADPVNHPPHYNSHPSGVECVTVAEHMNFCLGNALKYIWRAGLKSKDPIEDLKKARWYVDREIARLERQSKPTTERRKT